MMFKIRRKKKNQPTQDIQPADPTKSVAYSVLKAAVLHTRWQEMLGQCLAIPNQQAALTPLVRAVLTPSISDLIARAKQHDLITAEQAEELSRGHVGLFNNIELKEGV